MINTICRIAIICLLLVGAAGCESKSNSSSHPPTQQQDVPIEPPALSENARAAFSAFNKFQASTTFKVSDCGDSCTDSKQYIDFKPIEIKGITPSEYMPYKLDHSNENTYHYYKFYSDPNSLSFDENEEITLKLFTSNAIPYLDTNEEQYLNPPFSRKYLMN